MSTRQEAAARIEEWVRARRARFTAPYGIIANLAHDRRSRVVTFGIARVCDICISVYSPQYVIVRDSRYGTHRFECVDDALDALATRYDSRSAA